MSAAGTRPFAYAVAPLGVRLMVGFALTGCAVMPRAGQEADHALDALVAATEQYINLISNIGSGLALADTSAVRRHMAQLALLLPDEVKEQVTGGDLDRMSEAALYRPGTGAILAQWWSRQDPLPASPVNERLLEHVQRVQYAEAHFASANRSTGLDDRGEVYIRYGRPERELTVRFDEPEFTDKLYKFGMVLNQSNFPDNVFWRYGHIDGTAQFLFLEENGEYRIAGTTELLPRALRAGFTPQIRGQRRAEMALAAMRTIYRQLAAEDPVFLERYSEVDNYLADHEAPGRVAARVLGESFRRIVLDQDDDTELQPGGSERPASEVVQSVITSSKVKDDLMAYQRDLLMPATYTEVHRTLPPLPVAVRPARFLDTDGSTRTELYWSTEPGALRKKDLDEDYVLQVTAVQMDSSYMRRSVTNRLIQVTGLPRGRDAVIPPQMDIVRGDTAAYHVALQWDLHRVVRDSLGQAALGKRLRVGARYVDSLTPLNGSGTALEMSDLKPVMIWSAVEMVGESEPYPYRQVGADVPLGLYFEIYNLRYDEDDYTRYGVTYRIARRAGGDSEQAPTSVTSIHVGTRAMQNQEVLLDLTDWQRAGPVTVHVTVYDQTAQRGVTRSIDFELF